MTILCDSQIEKYLKKGYIQIRPFHYQNLQPNSYDVTLGDDIIVNGEMKRLPYTIKHGEFILATTKEWINIDRKCCCMIDGKSTTARHGLCVHITAGFIDCGFYGNITLEMVNYGEDYRLYDGMPIGQLIFYKSKTPDKKYNGHYQGQMTVKPAWDIF